MSNLMMDQPRRAERLYNANRTSSFLTPATFFIYSILLLPVLFVISFVQTRSTLVLQAGQSNSSVTPLDECTHPVYDNCSFYASCLESRYHCGPSGYPIGYGQRFCQTFSDERSKVSSQGQTWMLNTMHCLQTILVPEATGAYNLTCSELEDKAFASHPSCYIHSGICTLPPTDWLAILEIVRLKTVFQNRDAFEATVQTVEDCLDFWAFLVEQGIFLNDDF